MIYLQFVDTYLVLCLQIFVCVKWCNCFHKVKKKKKKTEVLNVFSN